MSSADDTQRITGYETQIKELEREREELRANKELIISQYTARYGNQLSRKQARRLRDDLEKNRRAISAKTRQIDKYEDKQARLRSRRERRRGEASISQAERDAQDRRERAAEFKRQSDRRAVYSARTGTYRAAREFTPATLRAKDPQYRQTVAAQVVNDLNQSVRAYNTRLERERRSSEAGEATLTGSNVPGVPSTNRPPEIVEITATTSSKPFAQTVYMNPKYYQVDFSTPYDGLTYDDPAKEKFRLAVEGQQKREQRLMIAKQKTEAQINRFFGDTKAGRVGSSVTKAIVLNPITNPALAGAELTSATEKSYLTGRGLVINPRGTVQEVSRAGSEAGRITSSAVRGVDPVTGQRTTESTVNQILILGVPAAYAAFRGYAVARGAPASRPTQAVDQFLKNRAINAKDLTYARAVVTINKPAPRSQLTYTRSASVRAQGVTGSEYFPQYAPGEPAVSVRAGGAPETVTSFSGSQTLTAKSRGFGSYGIDTQLSQVQLIQKKLGYGDYLKTASRNIQQQIQKQQGNIPSDRPIDSAALNRPFYTGKKPIRESANPQAEARSAGYRLLGDYEPINPAQTVKASEAVASTNFLGIRGRRAQVTLTQNRPGARFNPNKLGPYKPRLFPEATEPRFTPTSAARGVSPRPFYLIDSSARVDPDITPVINNVTGTGTSTAPGSVERIKTGQPLKPFDALDLPQKPYTYTPTRARSSSKPGIDSGSRIDQTTKQVQTLKPLLVSVPSSPSPRAPSPPQRPERPPRRYVPRVPVLPRRERAAARPGYDVFLRRGGRFFKANVRPLASSEAINFGAVRVGTTAAATFKIEKAGKPATGRFRGRGQLRDFVRKRGEYIEKPRRRIKSVGELREITFKGIRATRGRKKKKKSLFSGFPKIRYRRIV